MNEHQSIREYLSHIYLNEQVVFDETPNFDDISNKFSRQTMASDETLRGLVNNVVDAKKKALTLAIEIVEDNIDARKLSLTDIAPDTDTDPDHPIVSFSILTRDTGDVISGLKMEIGDNGTPVINLGSRTIKNQVEKSKSSYSNGIVDKLRLIETDEFYQIDSVQKALKKRNMYLNNVYKRVNKAISDMSFVEVSILKQILKSDYKGIK